MIKKKTILGLILVNILVNCGGSGGGSSSDSNKDKLEKKEFIVVLNNMNLNQCNLVTIKQNINGNIFGNLQFAKNISKGTIVVSSQKNNTSCVKYDRSNDDLSCTILDLQEATGDSCVVGFDFQ